MRTRVVIAALAALVAGAPASGADRPPFAQSYVGTVTGKLELNGRVDTWTVRGLTFTLQSARFARGRWGGTYLVTGGRVTYTTSLSGACAGTTSGALSLRRLSWDAAAISFLQNLRGSGYAYEARVSKEQSTSLAGCGEISAAGGLWLRTGIGQRLVPGRRLTGKLVDRSDRGTRTWTWNLAPRR